MNSSFHIPKATQANGLLFVHILLFFIINLLWIFILFIVVDNLVTIPEEAFARLTGDIRANNFLDSYSKQRFLFHKEQSYLVFNKQIDSEVFVRTVYCSSIIFIC